MTIPFYGHFVPWNIMERNGHKKMNKKSYRLSALLLWLLCLTLLPLSAWAAQESAEVILPVSVCVSGAAPAEDYRFRLTAVDKAPMPEKGQEYCELSCTGSGIVSFPAIPFDTVGIYHYTISQIPGTHPEVRYDSRNYDVTVTAANAEDGRRLTAAVSIRSDGKKYDSAEFVNEYVPKVTWQSIYVRKLWVDNGLERPESISVQLISEGQVVGTAVLNAQNSWSYAWKDLVESGKSWSVQELSVPRKYIVSYRYTDNTATITNTLTTGLIQTGQLTWPIWVLSGVGILLCAAGLTVLRKRRKNHE